MSEVVIQVEKLTKHYRLGTIGTGSLRQDLQRWWTTSVLRQEDPFFKFESADGGSAPSDKNNLWALRDINFEIKQGEVWGIIGHNGAGKSTLLKILSRIVRPTSGVVRGRGKISSMLEVGTGFHPELTGRENVYISGYILGMTKEEIRSKFDEIVAFSGIEKFIDTPVKRYSSGMYVRLAFAVAAHLEPDILIIDEVLAVGDADFQKKCLGKMREVSQSEGRTIIFVSHSSQAIVNLCDKALWLHQGKMKDIGNAHEIVSRYINSIQKFKLSQNWSTPEEAPGNSQVRFSYVKLVPQLNNPDDIMDIRVPLTVKFGIWNMADDVMLGFGLHLYSYSGECIFDVPSPSIMCQKGLVEAECTIPGDFLNDGSYFISIIAVRDTSVNVFTLEECLSFELEDYRGQIQWFDKWMGAVRPKLPFHVRQTENVLQ